MSARHPAGRLHYRGDNASALLGAVMGPTTFGALVVAESGTYDAETDLTTITFGYATDEDVREVARTGIPEVTP